MWFDLEFLKVQKERDDRPRYNGRQWRLQGAWPQTSLTPKFFADYHRVRGLASKEQQGAGVTYRSDFQHGTFGRLMLDYLASRDFKKQRPRTQVR